MEHRFWISVVPFSVLVFASTVRSVRGNARIPELNNYVLSAGLVSNGNTAGFHPVVTSSNLVPRSKIRRIR